MATLLASLEVDHWMSYDWLWHNVQLNLLQLLTALVRRCSFSISGGM